MGVLPVLSWWFGSDTVQCTKMLFGVCRGVLSLDVRDNYRRRVAILCPDKVGGIIRAQARHEIGLIRRNMTTATTLHSLLSTPLNTTPAQPVLLSTTRAPLLAAELQTQWQMVHGVLAAVGITPTDRVAIVLPNGPVLAVACLSLLTVTGCVPLNPAYTQAELQYFLSSLGVRLLLTDPQAVPHAQLAAASAGVPVLRVVVDDTLATGIFRLESDIPMQIAPGGLMRPSPDDIALVLHTSGSTAEPKIVPLRQHQLVSSAQYLIQSLALTADDRCLNALPLFHVGALVDLLIAPLASGGSVLVTDDMQASGLLQSLATQGITWYQAVPTMLQDLLTHVQDLAPTSMTHNLRFLRSVSSPLSPALLTALETQFGVPVIEIYGMTETAGVISSNPLPPGVRKVGSVGVSAGPEIVVIDQAGNPARTGHKGEILVRGSTVMAGYEGAAANADTFINGWLRTGDEGYCDREGYLFITGRTKDIINRGGEKISPREVDDAMMAHPSILEAAAFGVPHPSLGEDVAAAIVLKPGQQLDRQALAAFLAPRLAYFKVPHSLYFLDTLPKGNTGKVLRRKLAETVADIPAVSQVAFQAPESALAQDLAALWASLLDVPVVGMQDDFFELGGDSLKAATLMTRLQDSLGVDLTATALFDAPTLGEFEQWLSVTLASQEQTDSTNLSSTREQPTNGLPDEIKRPLSALLAGWAGLRATPESLLVGHNTLGSRQPVFWVSQDAADALALSRALGPEQPVYFMRSLYELPCRSVENNHVLARHYVKEMLSLQIVEPFLVCGFCEGGKIALEIAQMLRDGGKQVALLCMIDQYSPRYYDGPIALLYSQTRFSPYVPYRHPELAWSKLFPALRTVQQFSWGHSAYFREPVLSSFTSVLNTLLMQAVSSSLPPINTQKPCFAHSGAKLSLTVSAVSSLNTGEQHTLSVQIHNQGEVALPITDTSGVFLRNRWTRGSRPRIWQDGYTRLNEPLLPGETQHLSLTVTAPMKSGDWLLDVDLVEEGVAWLHCAGSGPQQQAVVVRKNISWLVQRLVRHFNKFTLRKPEKSHADTLG